MSFSSYPNNVQKRKFFHGMTEYGTDKALKIIESLYRCFVKLFKLQRLQQKWEELHFRSLLDFAARKRKHQQLHSNDKAGRGIL